MATAGVPLALAAPLAVHAKEAVPNADNSGAVGAGAMSAGELGVEDIHELVAAIASEAARMVSDIVTPELPGINVVKCGAAQRDEFRIELSERNEKIPDGQRLFDKKFRTELIRPAATLIGEQIIRRLNSLNLLGFEELPLPLPGTGALGWCATSPSGIIVRAILSYDPRDLAQVISFTSAFGGRIQCCWP